jgi:hypothetical protein
MKIKPKEVLINVPVVLMFSTEDEAANFASNINVVLHGKVKLKYDHLGKLGNQEAIIFYLQRNDEYHFIRDGFIELINKEELAIEQEELLKEEPSFEERFPLESILEINSETCPVVDFYVDPDFPAEDDFGEVTNPVFLSKEQMSKLTTQRLLAYKKKLYKYPEGPNWDTDDNMNKSRPEWKAAYKNIKEILSAREHIEK